MRTEVKLSRAYSVQLDGSGNGNLVIKVDATSEVWRPFHLTAKTTSQVAPFPSLDIYSGPNISGGVLVDTTASFVRVTTGRVGSVTITQGTPMFLVFAGGTPNDVITVGLFATKVVP